MRIIENMKYWFADKLNKKYETACWFNLVMWTCGYRSFYETFLDKNFSTNFWKYQYCKSHNELPYCGKCDVTDNKAYEKKETQ